MASLAKNGYMAKIGLDLSNIDKQIKTLQTELRAVDKALITNGDNAVLTSQRYKLLNDEAQKLAEKLQLLTDKRNDAESAAANGTLDPEQWRAYQREIINTGSALNDLRTQLGELNNEAASKQALADVTADLGNIHDQIADWTSSIAEFGEKAVAVLGAAAQDCIEVGKQFETSMSLVAATMGVDQMSEDYQRLEQAAKDYGATTRYTAAEVAV